MAAYAGAKKSLTEGFLLSPGIKHTTVLRMPVCVHDSRSQPRLLSGEHESRDSALLRNHHEASVPSGVEDLHSLWFHPVANCGMVGCEQGKSVQRGLRSRSRVSAGRRCLWVAVSIFVMREQP